MTNPAPLIGLIGRKRSGKDAFAATLVEHRGYARVAFADPLRELALAIDPLVGPAPLPGDAVARHRRLSDVIDAIGWEAAKDCVPEVRSTALQNLGQAVRGVDSYFWVDQAMESVRRLRGVPVSPYSGAPVVVTDVRMPNEANAIREAGGKLIRIVRPGFESADDHVTETALDGYPEDDLVVNDEGLDELSAMALYAADLLK